MYENCKGCLQYVGNGVCNVFLNINFQWQNGKKCWGYTDNEFEMLKRYEAILEYASRKGGEIKEPQRLVNYWRKRTEKQMA